MSQRWCQRHPQSRHQRMCPLPCPHRSLHQSPLRSLRMCLCLRLLRTQLRNPRYRPRLYLHTRPHQSRCLNQRHFQRTCRALSRRRCQHQDLQGSLRLGQPSLLRLGLPKSLPLRLRTCQRHCLRLRLRLRPPQCPLPRPRATRRLCLPKRRRRRPSPPSASTRPTRTGPLPNRANRVGRRGAGSGASSAPATPSGSAAVIRPSGSITAEMPVLAARTSGRPCSTARIRACARCCCGPANRPNQASLVICTIQSGRGPPRGVRAWRGKIAS
jgi:hypothetical protein